MAKKSPKQPKKPKAAAAAPTVAPAKPIPPDVLRKMAKFNKDSREIETSIWRSING